MLARILVVTALVGAAAPAAAQSPPAAGPGEAPAAAPAPEATPDVPRKRTPAPAGAEVYFHYPFDNTTTPPRITVRFGLRGMGIAPAEIVKPNTGHHHLLIDTDLPPLDRPIPSDENHLHFGNGQTEVKVTLTPGRHTLQLLMGDHKHIPHDPPIMSKKITIMVRPPKATATVATPGN